MFFFSKALHIGGHRALKRDNTSLPKKLRYVYVIPLILEYKKHLKNVGPIRHCEPPHAACPQQRQRVTEGTAMAP